VFFFQAEDGIRDYKVTGVQTCALPICEDVRWRDRRPAAPASDLPQGIGMRTITRVPRGPPLILTLPPNVFARSCIPTMPNDLRRSEERRVGKEWRSARGVYVSHKQRNE